MTANELKKVADKMGYRIIKKPLNTAMLLPCTCGCNRREHWYPCDKEFKVMLICKRCGKKVSGKNEINARVNWNKMISEETGVRAR